MYLEISLPHSKRGQRYKGTSKICKSPFKYGFSTNEYG